MFILKLVQDFDYEGISYIDIACSEEKDKLEVVYSNLSLEINSFLIELSNFRDILFKENSFIGGKIPENILSSLSSFYKELILKYSYLNDYIFSNYPTFFHMLSIKEYYNISFEITNLKLIQLKKLDKTKKYRIDYFANINNDCYFSIFDLEDIDNLSISFNNFKLTDLEISNCDFLSIELDDKEDNFVSCLFIQNSLIFSKVLNLNNFKNLNRLYLNNNKGIETIILHSSISKIELTTDLDIEEVIPLFPTLKSYEITDYNYNLYF